MSFLGNNLKYLLKKEGISENELSKRLGISQQIINRIISGINQNPKLSTLLPITQYFSISLDDLIQEKSSSSLKKEPLLTETGYKIPCIEFQTLKKIGLEQSISTSSTYIFIDSKNQQAFAMKMYDDSMEPKFSRNTLLIFEKDKDIVSGDFCLLQGDNNHYLFRQVVINSMDKKFIKCLDPMNNEFNIMPLPINFYILAALLESRNTFSF